MAKEKKQLTKKEQRSKYKRLSFYSKMGEYAVIPVPFFALMIANRDTWFGVQDHAWKIGLGGGLTIALLIASLVMVIGEVEKKNEYAGYLLVLMKWIMVCIIITLVENVLHTIAGVMWIATSGIATSFGLDVTRRKLLEKANEIDDQIKSAEAQLGKEQAIEEIKQEKTVKVKIKK